MPQVASRRAALSRTLRVSACAVASPNQRSVPVGPMGIRPREGLRPNRPVQDAGTRIEPPPSDACAIGTMPPATAAAEPPDEPPAESSRFHGLRVSPKAFDSVVNAKPSSGLVDFAKITSPARL